ncbi:MAG: homocysteine S-methyltransferase family protein [Candidatus Rokubacteria bacterium]|nr:homocysteine S-methyltransferase family protein [Candidatus Rokubacteria bacterium]
MLYSTAMTGLLERLSTRTPLLTDSATGTWFQQRLGVQHVGGECCDQYNLTQPDVVRELYRAKVDAGADLVLTNTFNSTPLRLREFDLEDEADRFNDAGVRLLREVVAESGREVFVGGNVGPTGKLVGQSATYDEVMDSVLRQVRALVRAGVDAICVETMLQSLEGQIAVEAARQVFADEGVSVPLYVTFAFMNRPAASTAEFRTFFGDTVRQIMEGNEDLLAERPFVGVRQLGVDVVGANCTIGVDDAVAVTEEFTRYLVAHGLAGRMWVSAKPNSQVMATMQYEEPEFVAARFARFVEAGAHFVGYCCGSTPAHIAATARQRRALLGF